MTDKKPKFNLEPSNFTEAMRFAEIIARSSFVPKQFYNKPGDILLAVQMGMEVGLKPLQAIQNIAIINGKPSIYGDALLALVKNHPDFIDIEEKLDGEVATCTITRKNQKPCVSTFSKADAIKAKLWGKTGAWTDYPSRMLQMRARGFCLRDSFPDALLGFITVEEARDYPPQIIENVTPETIENVTPVTPVTPVLVNSTDQISDSVPDGDTEYLNKEEILDSVEQLIIIKNISSELIQRWCAKAEVETLDQMPIDKLKRCRDFLVAA